MSLWCKQVKENITKCTVLGVNIHTNKIYMCIYIASIFCTGNLSVTNDYVQVVENMLSNEKESKQKCFNN